MMKLKHKCLYCQQTASRMWNLKRHMQSVHGIKKSNSYANSDDVIPHYQSKYQPSKEEHQYGQRFKDASTQYSENDSTIPLVVTNTANEIMQEKQAEIEYYKNIIESLESKKKYFIDLCSLSKSDVQNYMRQCSDKDIQLICEACQRLHLYDDLKRDSLYKFIIALADKNVKVPYKRYILESVGAELLPLIRSFIIPLLVETIEKDSKILFGKMI